MHASRAPEPSPDPLQSSRSAQVVRRNADNARLGLRLFTVYVLLYAGFILLATFRHDLLARTLFGVNLAILYGVGLIGAALVLALVYMYLCRGQSDAARGERA